MPSVASSFAAHRRRCTQPRAAAPPPPPPGSRRLHCDPRQSHHRQAKGARDAQDRSGGESLDPEDPLPRTMEELYRRIANEPPLNPEDQYRKALEPVPDEMAIIEEAVRTTFRCTEDDAWWETHAEDWERMAENPGRSFALGVDDETRGEQGEVWGMEDYFGEETPAWKLSDEGVGPYSLGAYKAGIARLAAGAEGEGRRRREPAELFELTPFAQYWDSLPDLRTAGRVYVYNALDHMAALKFLMNCTCNGMHGSAESMQSGHFLWGYVDQVDWMRRSGRLSSSPGSIKERFRRAQWAAHLESLRAVETLYGEEFDKLPSDAEREFARGWCRAARLFAEAAAHTNLERCLFPLGAGYAPERMLTDGHAGGVTAQEAPESSPEGGFQDGPPDWVAETGSDDGDPDPAEAALATRRCVASVRWLGTLRAPVFGALRRLWRRSCTSYPARREAARVLRDACYGGRRAKAAAWGKSFLFLFVPDVNYRKLTLPLGVDEAEEVEYDPDFMLYDFSRPPPRPAGSLPLNPLQRPWYDGRRPNPSAAGTPGAGWDEDDDGLLESWEVALGGMFPRGREPVDNSFEALQRREREIIEDLRAAREKLDQEMRRRSEEGSSSGVGASAARSGATAKPKKGASQGAWSPKTVLDSFLRTIGALA
ncbi:unnamed protein product [Hapterophycus canaliculatus]